MNRIQIVLAAWFVAMTVVPAWAGKVTVRNLHGEKSYYVEYVSWTFGVNNRGGLCADTGKTEWADNIADSIGTINVHMEVGNCSSGSHHPKSLKEFTPDGTFLPHRTYTVIIQHDGTISITEP